MRRKGTLDPQEQALWDQVIATVKPMHPQQNKPVARGTPVAKVEREILSKNKNSAGGSARPTPSKEVRQNSAPRPADLARGQQAAKAAAQGNLDSHWDRRFKKGAIRPDVSIDLHGTGLAGAYQRLDAALEQAVHQHLRVILLVTGKPRAHDRASGQGRGAIATVVRDWLSASRHASRIAAIRNAHPRHGGSGALYIILKR